MMGKRALVLIYLFVPLLTTYCSSDTDRLQWHEELTHRWATAEAGYFDGGGFRMVNSDQTNIDFFTHITQQEINRNQIVLNGTGVATGDINGDGWADIYFTQLNGSNKLYKNTGGFRFIDITDKAGVAHDGNYSTGTVMADVDGDGDIDLLVSTIAGQNAVYLNDGQGHFELKTDSGLRPGNGSTTMSMADIDRDGDLDLFMANNKQKPVYDIFSEQELAPKNLVRRPAGRQVPGKTRYEFKEPFGQYYRFIYRKNNRAMMEEVGEYNQLYLNDGNGHFTEVTKQGNRFLNHRGKPAKLKPEWSLTARFQDLNGDQLPDLYVCNDYFNPDRIWINQGEGKFRVIDPYAVRSFSYSAMGIDISDINRDGHNDFFVTEMLSSSYQRQASQYTSKDMRPAMVREPFYQPQYMHNSLYLNRGDNTFREIAYYSGLEASEWSWATRFLDLDLDGYEDLIINTGYPYNAIDMDYSYNSSRYKGAVNLKKAPQLDLQNKIFRNNGDLTFSDRSSEWGFTEQDVSYGLATADFDNDGDLDIVTSRFRKQASIFENDAAAPRIAVRLQGTAPNTGAVGAKVVLEGGPVRQSKQVVSGGDYLSGSDPQLMFAAGSENKIHRITVKWPGGHKTVIDSVRANRIYEIPEPQDGSMSRRGNMENSQRQHSDPVFKDISHQLNHTHRADSFDDFRRQPLLSFKISGEGPGISWIDFDRDKDDDLFIVGGRDGRVSVYENLGNSEFEQVDAIANTTEGDFTTVLGWSANGKMNIVAGISNYKIEENSAAIPSALVFEKTGNEILQTDEMPGSRSSTGPLAAADYDQDGNVDLFIGGRAQPNSYPKEVGSKLYKNTGSSFKEDRYNNDTLSELGLVTGALFSDYDADNDPDLFVSTEWGPVRLFENEQGTFNEVTENVGLNSFKGRWTSIAAGDFNNDGLIDIVATNVGSNIPHQRYGVYPLRMYYSDLNMDGSTEIIEAAFDPQMQDYVPVRKLYDFKVFSSVLGNKITSFNQYASQSLQGLFGRMLSQMPVREVNTLEQMVFINFGEGFEARALPPEAQFTTATGAAVADYDNDGNEDIFLAQNFFGVYDAFPRQDAGRGLWLRGDGNGNFEAISAIETGIRIYGQQRGAALADFNGDARIDLAVTQRDSTTKLYRNTVNMRGIRVRLEGPPSNRAGIGASIRVVYADGGKGPVREIRAGTGRWSMNSPVVVLGTAKGAEPESLEIQWSAGKQTTVAVEPGRWSYNVRY